MNKSRITDVLNRWAEGINTAEYASVVAMYAQGASLLPTFSGHACRTTSDIENYFTGVSKNDKVTVSFDHDSLQFDSLGDAYDLVTGLYDWVIVSGDETTEVHARFSYVISANNNHPILHQHSSVVPE